MHQAADGPADSHLDNETADMAPGYAPSARHYYVIFLSPNTYRSVSGKRTFSLLSFRLHHGNASAVTVTIPRND